MEKKMENEMETQSPFKGVYRDLTPIMENRILCTMRPAPKRVSTPKPVLGLNSSQVRVVVKVMVPCGSLL